MKKSNSNKEEWLQHLLTVSAIAGLTCLYILLLKKSIKFSSYELILQVIPNLIAVLITWVVVYQVLIKKGITPYNKLKDSIILEMADLLKPDSFKSQHETDKEFNLKDKLINAKEVLIVGYSCKYLIGGLRTEIVEAIQNKTNIKVLAIAPDSDASKLMSQFNNFQELKFDVKGMKHRLQLIKDEVSNSISKKKSGSIELRLVNWIPSCSLIFYIPKNNESGILKLKVYGVDHGVTLSKIRTHKLIYEFKEKELYNDFLLHFHGLWKKGEVEELN